MSKHIDLLAVGALLLVFAFGAHVKNAIHLQTASVKLLRIHGIHPVVIAPPHVPALPRLPHFPRV